MANNPHKRFRRRATVHCSGQAKQAGLTLIELLVAISVLAFVAVLGWRGLDAIVRTRVSLTSDMAKMTGMQLTFAQLQNDCARIANTATLSGRPVLSTWRGRMMLARTVSVDNQPTHMQVVVYRIKNDVLVRTESAATRDLAELDALWERATSEMQTASEVALQTDVMAMPLRTWSDSGEGWRAAGLDPPGPTLHKITGLEVTFQFRDQTSVSKIFLLGAT